MATFVIGDIHGCWPSLKELFKELPKKAKIVFIGDIINRGPESLKSIRFAMSEPERFTALMGNHEMHLLGVAAGIRKLHKADTLQPILDAPDFEDIVNWVRTLPFAIERKDFLCVHAGVHQDWTREDALKYSGMIQQKLMADDWKSYMPGFFGRDQWVPRLPAEKQLQAMINVFTRMRYLNGDGTMNWEAKLWPEDYPDLIPWFKYPNRKTADDKITFGHWSTLGNPHWPNIYPTDTGCLWGGKLSALKIGSHPKYVRVKAPQYLSPKKA